MPGIYYRLIKTDQTTRMLANPQLRTAEGIAAQARFGERVPVPVTTFAPIATGGVQQQPITSFNYENIGVNIDITPRMHHDDDVSLALKVEVSSISGVGFGGLPTFGNRFINTVIRLKDGETNMLAGLIRDDERNIARRDSRAERHARSWAGCSRTTSKETQQTDIILTLTPHIVRVLDLDESGSAAVPRGPRRSAAGIDLAPQPMSRSRQPIQTPRPTASAAAAAGTPPAVRGRSADPPPAPRYRATGQQPQPPPQCRTTAAASAG